MSFKELLVKWSEAVNMFDNMEYSESLALFSTVSDISKIHFNMGVVSLKLKDVDNSIDSFSRAITLDNYFAVAYFQRAHLLFIINDVEGALEDYQDCYEKLRSNSFINYSQLGLEYILHESYIIFNIALCFLALGETDRGCRYVKQALSSALSSAESATHSPVMTKIRSALKYVESGHAHKIVKIGLYYLDKNILFRPQEDNMQNSKKVDYLGVSKIVAGNDRSDTFNGFSGRRVKELTLGRQNRKNANPISPVSPSARTLPISNGGSSKEQNSSSRKPFVRSRSEGSIRTNEYPDTRPNMPSIRENESASFPRPTPRAKESDLHTYDRTSSREKHWNVETSREDEESNSDKYSYDSDEYSDDYTEKERYARAPQLPPRNSSATTPVSPYFAKDEDVFSGDSLARSLNDSEENRQSTRDKENMLRIKAYFKGCRYIYIPIDADYSNLVEAVCKKFRSSKLLIKFIDESGRKTIMSNDDDLAEALDLSEEEDVLSIWCFEPAR